MSSWSNKRLLRCLAAVSLTVWVVAFGVCSVECSTEDADSDEAPTSVSPLVAQHGSSDDADSDSDHHGSHDDTFCQTLKALTPLTPAHFDFQSNNCFAIALGFLPFPSIDASSEQIVLRQPPDREWVFTPEVSLGPAFRSLAPPFSALT